MHLGCASFCRFTVVSHAGLRARGVATPAPRAPRSPGKVSYLCLPSLDQDHRKVLGAMGPQNQNSLDVSGPTRARDERDKTGVVFNVPCREQLKGRQIRHELIGSGNDQVMRRQDRQGTPARILLGNEGFLRTVVGLQAAEPVA
jgi:hypothetical protein